MISEPEDHGAYPPRLRGISSMKELDARYAKRVITATAELNVYTKSMIKFIREYSDAMAKIGIVEDASY